LGKPAFNDLKEGIVTAPIIYALLEQQHRDMAHGSHTSVPPLSNKWHQAVLRNFKNDGDVEEIGKPMLA